jgi:hypothetical protein
MHVTNPVMSFSCILSFKSDITLSLVDSYEAENVISRQSVVQHPNVLYYFLLTILSLSHTCL